MVQCRRKVDLKIGLSNGQGVIVQQNVSVMLVKC